MSILRATGYSFAGKNLEGIYLDNARLNNAWFYETNLKNSKFLNCEMNNAQFNYANLENV